VRENLIGNCFFSLLWLAESVLRAQRSKRMPKAAGDAKLLIQSLNKAYAATPTNLKVITNLSLSLSLSQSYVLPPVGSGHC
jgi:hypothetical protein